MEAFIHTYERTTCPSFSLPPTFSGAASQWTANLAIFKAIEDENLEELKKCLLLVDDRTDLNETASGKLGEEDRRNIMNVLSLRDPSGLTPLLFAADRGLHEVSVAVKLKFIFSQLTWNDASEILGRNFLLRMVFSAIVFGTPPLS